MPDTAQTIPNAEANTAAETAEAAPVHGQVVGNPHLHFEGAQGVGAAPIVDGCKIPHRIAAGMLAFEAVVLISIAMEDFLRLLRIKDWVLLIEAPQLLLAFTGLLFAVFSFFGIKGQRRMLRARAMACAGCLGYLCFQYQTMGALLPLIVFCASLYISSFTENKRWQVPLAAAHLVGLGLYVVLYVVLAA